MVHATQLRSTAYRDAWMAIGREHKNFSLRVVPNCLTEQRSEIVHCGFDACSATGEEGDRHGWSEEDPAGGGALQPQDVRAVAVATTQRIDYVGTTDLLGLRPPVLGACAVGRTRFYNHSTSRCQSHLCTVKYDL